MNKRNNLYTTHPVMSTNDKEASKAKEAEDYMARILFIILLARSS